MPGRCDAAPLRRLSERWADFRGGLFAKRAARFVATAPPIFSREAALSLRIKRRARRGLANTSGLIFLSIDSRTHGRFQSHWLPCQVSCADAGRAYPPCAYQ